MQIRTAVRIWDRLASVFVRSGHFSNVEKPLWETTLEYDGTLVAATEVGYYWPNSALALDLAYGLNIYHNDLKPESHWRLWGFSLRCLAI